MLANMPVASVSALAVAVAASATSMSMLTRTEAAATLTVTALTGTFASAATTLAIAVVCAGVKSLTVPCATYEVETTGWLTRTAPGGAGVGGGGKTTGGDGGGGEATGVGGGGDCVGGGEEEDSTTTSSAPPPLASIIAPTAPPPMKTRPATAPKIASRQTVEDGGLRVPSLLMPSLVTVLPVASIFFWPIFPFSFIMSPTSTRSLCRAGVVVMPKSSS